MWPRRPPLFVMCLVLLGPIFFAQGERHISLSARHSCIVVASNLSIACAGDNSNGQSTPQVGPFQAVSVGDTFSCGLASGSGFVLCWGRLVGFGWNGVAGTAAVSLQNNAKYIDVAAGPTHVCALLVSGLLKCVGEGVVVNNTPSTTQFQAISSGTLFSCGVARDYSLACWGSPTLVAAFNASVSAAERTFVEVAAGASHACALRLNGTVLCWGLTGAPPPGATFAWISSGSNFACGIANYSDLTVTCWGPSAPLSSSSMRGAAELSCWSDCMVLLSSGEIPTRPTRSTELLPATLLGAAWIPTANLSSGNASATPAQWAGVASSNDNSNLKLFALQVTSSNAGVLHTSTSGGATWASGPACGTARSIAVSATGLRVFLCGGPQGRAFASMDGGASCFPVVDLVSNNVNCTAVALSGDGNHAVAVSATGNLYIPVGNPISPFSAKFVGSGSVFLVRNVGPFFFVAAAASYDGSRLVAVTAGSTIFTSANFGETWQQQSNSGVQAWTSVASSTNGDVLFAAAAANGGVFSSSNFGATWVRRGNASSWSSIACSSDGTVVVVTAANGASIATSLDSGLTWRTSLLEGSSAALACTVTPGIAPRVALASAGGVLYRAGSGFNGIAGSVFSRASFCGTVTSPLQSNEGIAVWRALSINACAIGTVSLPSWNPPSSSYKLHGWNTAAIPLDLRSSPALSNIPQDMFNLFAFSAVTALWLPPAPLQLTSGSLNGLSSLTAINSAAGSGVFNFSNTGVYVRTPGNWSWGVLNSTISPSVQTLLLDASDFSVFLPTNVAALPLSRTLSQISYLSLQSTQIKQLDGQSFAGFSQLATLRLDDNVFAFIAPNTLGVSNFSRLSSVSFIGSQLLCSTSGSYSIASVSAWGGGSLPACFAVSLTSTPKLSPSPSPTASRTATSTASLSASSSLTSSVTSSLTATSSTSPSLTPSPTPAMAVAGASLALSSGSVGSGSVYPVPPAAGAGATAAATVNVTLTLQGSAMRALCVDALTPTSVGPLSQWTSASLNRGGSSPPSVVCTDSLIVADYADIAADATRLLWMGAPFAFVLSGRALSATVTPVAPLVRASGATGVGGFSWGDTLQLQGLGLGLANAPSARIRCLGAASPACVAVPFLPCTNLANTSADSVVCNVRFFSSQWVGHASMLGVELLMGATHAGSATLFAWTPLNVNITMSAAPRLLANSSAPLPREGGGAVDVLLPFAAWTSAESTSLRLLNGQSTTIAATPAYLCIDGTCLANSPCAVDAINAALLHCTAPPGHGINRTAVVTFGDVLGPLRSPLAVINVSGSAASASTYLPPPVLSISPSWLQVPDASFNPSSSLWSFDLNLTFASGEFEDLFLISHVAVTGIPCGGHSISPGVISCLQWRSFDLAQRAAAYAQQGIDALPFSVSFSWAGATYANISSPSGSIVLRPTIASLSPTIVSAGGVFVIFGENLCGPQGPCGVGTRIYVGDRTYPCTASQVISATTATCTSPAIPSSYPGYPFLNVTIETSVGSVSAMKRSAHARIEYSLSGVVSNASVLPTHFLPSDTNTKWALPAPLSFRLFPPSTNATTASTPFAGPFKCTLSTLTAGVLLLPISLSNLTDVASAGGTVQFQDIAIMSFFDAASVMSPTTVILVAACTADSIPSIQSFAFAIEAYAVYASLCEPPPPSAQSQVTLRPWSVAISVAGYEVISEAEGGCNASRRVWPALAPALPPKAIVCTVTVADGAATSSSLQGASAVLDAASGAAIFASTSVGGTVEKSHNLTISCGIGSIPIPPALTAPLYITGCGAGSEPSAGGTGATCSPCLSDFYSPGGATPCRSCPKAGVVCSGGVLSLLPGFFRPPAEGDGPLTADSQLLPCAFPAGCVLRASNYSCALGYTGPLCGVCDASVGYSKTGDACVPCLSAGSSTAIIVIGIALLVLVLGVYVVRKAEPPQASSSSSAVTAAAAGNGGQRAVKDASAGSTALRILLTHTQMLGTLIAFKTSGTNLFKTYMSWTSVLGTEVVTDGPSQCLMRPSFVSSFMSILALPVVAAAVAVAILLGSSLIQELLRADAGARRGATQGMPSPAKKAHEEGQGTSALAGGAQQPPPALWQRVRAAVSAKLQTGRHIAIIVFVVHLAYMPVVSACLKVFNCTDFIAGKRFLVQDMRVECAGPTYTAVQVVAGLIVLLLGLGYPAFIFWLLSTSTQERLELTNFKSTWDFLYAGYKQGRRNDEARGGASLLSRRSPLPVFLPPSDDSAVATGAAVAAGAASSSSSSSSPSAPPSSPLSAVAVTRTHSRLAAQMHRLQANLVWWESTVLLRKAGIVLLANLVTDATFQIAGVALWVAIFLIAHTRCLPYKVRSFNRTEFISLITVLFTAIFCFVTGTEAGSSSSRALAATVIMLAINFVAVAVLLYTAYLYGPHASVSGALQRVVVGRAGAKPALRASAPTAAPGQPQDGDAASGSFQMTNPLAQQRGAARNVDASSGSVFGVAPDAGAPRNCPIPAVAEPPPFVIVNPLSNGLENSDAAGGKRCTFESKGVQLSAGATPTAVPPIQTINVVPTTPSSKPVSPLAAPTPSLANDDDDL